VKLSDIQIAIFGKVESVNNLLPVAFPFEKFDKPANGGAYAVLHIVPNDTQDAWCGTSKTGNILFNLSYSEYSKLIDPTIEAEKFLSLFSEGLEFDGVRINDEGTIRNPVPDREDNGRYFVPVIIKYEA
jgi:hypothetical protein